MQNNPFYYFKNSNIAYRIKRKLSLELSTPTIKEQIIVNSLTSMLLISQYVMGSFYGSKYNPSFVLMDTHYHIFQVYHNLFEHFQLIFYCLQFYAFTYNAVLNIIICRRGKTQNLVKNSSHRVLCFENVLNYVILFDELVCEQHLFEAVFLSFYR